MPTMDAISLSLGGWRILAVTLEPESELEIGASTEIEE